MERKHVLLLFLDNYNRINQYLFKNKQKLRKKIWCIYEPSVVFLSKKSRTLVSTNRLIGRGNFDLACQNKTRLMFTVYINLVPWSQKMT